MASNVTMTMQSNFNTDFNIVKSLVRTRSTHFDHQELQALTVRLTATPHILFLKILPYFHFKTLAKSSDVKP